MNEVGLGTQVAGYRIVALLGQGGMGTVYRAEHSVSGESVALKVLNDSLASSEDFRRRFVREARYARELDHPNVVGVREVGDDGGRMYMIMPEIHGTDLKTLLALEGPLDPQRTLSILAPIADALDALHGKGILHRDIKPGNVIVASGAGEQPEGRAYLTDFGLGKDPDRDSAPLTGVGEFVGSYFYAAPEQVLGRELDHKVDVYALGCVLYECLAGLPPYVRDRPVDVLDAHIEDPPPKPTAVRSELPPAIDEVVARALAKDPADRYARAMEMMDAAGSALGSDTAPGGKSGVLVLRVTAGTGAGGEIRITDELVIGRHSAGEGNLAGDPEISRSHARIWRGDDAFRIEDLGSTNGTIVSGKRIDSPRALAKGDTIEVGATTLVVEAVPATEAAPPQPPRAPATEVSLGAAPTREETPVDSGRVQQRPAPSAEEIPMDSGRVQQRPEPTAAPTPEGSGRVPQRQPPPVEVSAGPVSLHLTIDFDAREARVSVGEEGTALRLVERDGRWLVELS